MLLPCMTRMRRQGAERQQRRLIDRGARVEEGAWRLSSVASARDAAAARRCPPRDAAAAAAAVRPSGQGERRDRRESSELTSGKTFRRSARERRSRLRAQRPSAAAAARHGTRPAAALPLLLLLGRCSVRLQHCICCRCACTWGCSCLLLPPMRRALLLLLRCRTPCPRRLRSDAHDTKRSRCRAFPRTNIRCGRSAALHELGLLAPSELALNRGLAARRQLGCRQTAAAAAIRGG
jgi:hypothetical protein